jgi:hypothetical protein
MKKLITISFVLIFIWSFTNVQTSINTFEIIQKDTKYSNEFCEKAISEANWCGFRYENKRHIIQFDTGLKIELFSAKEIGETNSNCFLTDYRDFSTDIWQITPSGKIVHKMPIQKTK